MIEARDVSLVYGDGTEALKDVNLKIDKGDIVYITGHSGSGKTSLLKLFMGIEYPTKGQLKVLDLDIKKEEENNIRKMRRLIGPVFQEFKLIRGRTALENVMLGLRFLNLPHRKIKEESIIALEKVGLGHKRDSLVEHLSFGETQRVAIARAVVRKPAIILADEPTGNLDLDNALNIMELLTSFRDEDTAVIITTHATHLLEDIDEGKFIRVNQGQVTVESRGEA
ncbi:MAG: ATP-binding cassette domain-containing protein [Tissierellia bacterium]|nr:ATP-binding cassette domain-containing protein [Tissierellia bacterium]